MRVWNTIGMGQHYQIGNNFVGHTDYVFYVAYSPDGSVLASASMDGTVRPVPPPASLAPSLTLALSSPSLCLSPPPPPPLSLSLSLSPSSLSLSITLVCACAPHVGMRCSDDLDYCGVMRCF